MEELAGPLTSSISRASSGQIADSAPLESYNSMGCPTASYTNTPSSNSYPWLWNVKFVLLSPSVILVNRTPQSSRISLERGSSPIFPKHCLLMDFQLIPSILLLECWGSNQKDPFWYVATKLRVKRIVFKRFMTGQSNRINNSSQVRSPHNLEALNEHLSLPIR
jgi:hypothetical protein